MKPLDAKHVFVSLAAVTVSGLLAVLPASAEPGAANRVGQEIGKQFSGQFLIHDGEQRGEDRGNERRDEHRDESRHDTHQNEPVRENRSFPQNGGGFGGQHFDDHQREQAHEQAEVWQRAQQQALQQQAYEHQLHEAREHAGLGNGWYTPWHGGYGQAYDRPHLTYRFILEGDAEGWLDDDAYEILDRWALANFDRYHWGRLDAREYEQSRRYFWQVADLNHDGFISEYEWHYFCNHYARPQYGYR